MRRRFTRPNRLSQKTRHPNGFICHQHIPSSLAVAYALDHAVSKPAGRTAHDTTTYLSFVLAPHPIGCAAKPTPSDPARQRWQGQHDGATAPYLPQGNSRNLVRVGPCASVQHGGRPAQPSPSYAFSGVGGKTPAQFSFAGDETAEIDFTRPIPPPV